MTKALILYNTKLVENKMQVRMNPLQRPMFMYNNEANGKFYVKQWPTERNKEKYSK